MARPDRSKKYVDADVQGALARRLIFHWVIFLTIAFVTAFVLQILVNPFRAPAEHLQNLVWNQGPFLLVLVCLLPVFVIDSIKVSHRFAGPICNLRQAMRSIVQGEPPKKLKFRDQDFWKGLADDYNAMLTRLAPADQNVSEDS